VTLDDRAWRTRAAHWIVLGTLVLANVGVTIALAREAFSKKTVIVVPGVDRPREVTASEPSPELVRDFAFLYLAHFDSYTPATVDAATRHVTEWLSPRFYTQASEALARRRELVAQSRMASQVLLPARSEATVRRADGGEYEVTLTAVRRVYIADRLQSETALVYTVAVEPCTPTLGNPYGLYVVGQRIEPRELSHAEK